MYEVFCKLVKLNIKSIQRKRKLAKEMMQICLLKIKEQEILI